MNKADSIQPLVLQAGDQPLAALRPRDGGTPVLALHGWLDNALSFAQLWPLLDTIDLVCLDFPGHGESPPRPAAARYHFDDYVFDVLAAADALGWERFHLLGHSLGGAVASVTAAACPERVISLAVIEGLGPLTAPPDRTAEGWRKAIHASRQRPRRIHSDRSSAIEARIRNSDLPVDAAELLAERGLEPAGDGWRWRHDLRLTWPSTQRYSEPQVLDLLGHIECPVLCLLARPRTRIVPAGMIEGRIAAVRRLEFAELDGGHHLHMQQPAAVAALLRRHLDAHA